MLLKNKDAEKFIMYMNRERTKIEKESYIEADEFYASKIKN